MPIPKRCRTVYKSVGNTTSWSLHCSVIFGANHVKEKEELVILLHSGIG